MTNTNKTSISEKDTTIQYLEVRLEELNVEKKTKEDRRVELEKEDKELINEIDEIDDKRSAIKDTITYLKS